MKTVIKALVITILSAVGIVTLIWTSLIFTSTLRDIRIALPTIFSYEASLIMNTSYSSSHLSTISEFRKSIQKELEQSFSKYNCMEIAKNYAFCLDGKRVPENSLLGELGAVVHFESPIMIKDEDGQITTVCESPFKGKRFALRLILPTRFSKTVLIDNVESADAASVRKAIEPELSKHIGTELASSYAFVYKTIDEKTFELPKHSMLCDLVWPGSNVLVLGKPKIVRVRPWGSLTTVETTACSNSTYNEILERTSSHTFLEKACVVTYHAKNPQDGMLYLPGQTILPEHLSGKSVIEETWTYGRPYWYNDGLFPDDDFETHRKAVYWSWWSKLVLIIVLVLIVVGIILIATKFNE